ncbi:unnamed protein product [Ectocarpus sp. 4 AP-2014]
MLNTIAASIDAPFPPIAKEWQGPQEIETGTERRFTHRVERGRTRGLKGANDERKTAGRDGAERGAVRETGICTPQGTDGKYRLRSDAGTNTKQGYDEGGESQLCKGASSSCELQTSNAERNPNKQETCAVRVR